MSKSETFLVTGIEWDVSGTGNDGTDELLYALPDMIEIDIESGLDEEEREIALSDAITDIVGFCHKGFRYVKLVTLKVPIMMYDRYPWTGIGLQHDSDLLSYALKNNPRPLV